MKRVLAGDTEAADRLVRRHHAAAWRAAQWATDDPTLADEALQEGFIRAIRYLPSYDPERPFGAWLAGIVVNRVQSIRTARGAHLELPLEAAEAIGRDATAAVDARLDLTAALDSLPADQRKALIQCAVIGLSTEEAAAASGVTPGALRVRISRARARLRRTDAVA